MIAVNDGNLGRPLTAAAHELGHALGLPHADSYFAPGTCGGNSNGQVGEQWLPDGRGRLQGVAFDRAVRVDAGLNTAATALYDLMSSLRVGPGGLALGTQLEPERSRSSRRSTQPGVSAQRRAPRPRRRAPPS